MKTPLLLIALLIASSAVADVVHLKDGRLIRGRLLGPRHAAVLEIETLDGRLRVAEEDLLLVHEAAHLRRTISAAERGTVNDPSGLSRLGRWALEKGMFDEALRLFDRALALDRDRAVTLPAELLRVPVVSIGQAHDLLPEDVPRLLAAGLGPEHQATGKVAELRLMNLARRSNVTEALLSGLRHQQTGVRLRTTKVLSELRPPGSFQALVRTALADHSREVRQTALSILGRFENQDPLPVCTQALAQGDRALRDAALDAFEFLADPRALGALARSLRRAGYSAPGSVITNVEQTTYVSGFDVDVANSAFIANPRIGVLQPGHTVEVRAVAAGTHRQLTGPNRIRAVRLMETLSGQSFGDDPERWRRWLDARDPHSVK